MSIEQRYYEAYWSPEGWRANVSGSNPELQHFLAGCIPATVQCLDVGCGDGRTYGRWLRDRVAGYVGVDISEAAVSQARRLGLDARVVQDAVSLPFPDQSFDVAVCIEVLEHLFQPHAAAKEIFRVLRPGGFLVVTVPNIAYWRRRLDLALGRWNPMGDDLSVQQPWRDPHIRFFTSGSLRRMLGACGFGSVRIDGYEGRFLSAIPGLRRLASQRGSVIYRRIERVEPSLLALRLRAIAVRPQA